VIETVIGRGYRFTAEPMVEAAAPEPRVADDAPIDGPIVVGRSAEIGVLRAALERATAGHRQLCFVTGEPGIGKTTLVESTADVVDARRLLA
jgi:MoxR-like ATPase